LASDDIRSQFSNILTYLLRLRQLACATALAPQEFIDTIVEHGTLAEQEIEVGSASINPEKKKALEKSLSENRNQECPICYNVRFEKTRCK